MCVNTAGGYKCDCQDGWTGDGTTDGTGCTDVDECEQTSPAVCGRHSECDNLPGTYECECEEGYMSPTENGKKL